MDHKDIGTLIRMSKYISSGSTYQSLNGAFPSINVPAK